MPATGGRGTGSTAEAEGGMRMQRANLMTLLETGEPNAVKAARPVRGGACDTRLYE